MDSELVVSRKTFHSRKLTDEQALKRGRFSTGSRLKTLISQVLKICPNELILPVLASGCWKIKGIKTGVTRIPVCCGSVVLVSYVCHPSRYLLTVRSGLWKDCSMVNVTPY